VQVASADQVGLLDEVEQEVLLPGLVGEALVALVGAGHRGAGNAHQSQGGLLPQPEMVAHHRHLCLRQAVGAGQ